MALIHTINVGGVQYDVKATHYATSTTSSSTAAKTASIQNGSFTLEIGVRVSVKFTYANTASNPTLNINSTGAKAIRWRDSNLITTQYWSGGQIVDFIYDGTYWNIIGTLNSPIYTQPEAPSDAPEGSLWVDTDEEDSGEGTTNQPSAGLPTEGAVEGAFLRYRSSQAVWELIDYAEENGF